MTHRTRTVDRREAPASEDTRPRLLFFHSPASGPCKRFDGLLAQVIQRGANHDTFRTYRIDTRSRPDLTDRFGVTTVPTLLVVEGGRIAARLEGKRRRREIEESLSRWLHT